MQGCRKPCRLEWKAFVSLHCRRHKSVTNSILRKATTASLKACGHMLRTCARPRRPPTPPQGRGEAVSLRALQCSTMQCSTMLHRCTGDLRRVRVRCAQQLFSPDFVCRALHCPN